MKKAPKYHRHRVDGPYVFGFELEAGDTLEPDDVYNSTSGNWEKCPCPGLTLGGEGANVKWVRPASAYGQEKE